MQAFEPPEKDARTTGHNPRLSSYTCKTQNSQQKSNKIHEYTDQSNVSNTNRKR